MVNGYVDFEYLQEDDDLKSLVGTKKYEQLINEYFPDKEETREVSRNQR